MMRPPRFDLMTRTITSPQQKRRIGRAALLIGTCSVAAADPQITSNENQVLKRNQLLAGIHCRRVLNVIFCIPSNARLESQAKPMTRAESFARHKPFKIQDWACWVCTRSGTNWVHRPCDFRVKWGKYLEMSGPDQIYFSGDYSDWAEALGECQANSGFTRRSEKEFATTPQISSCSRGVLHYLPDPSKTLADLLRLGMPIVFIDRTALIDSDHDRLTIQHVPEWIYRVDKPAWFLSETKVLSSLTDSGCRVSLRFPRHRQLHASRSTSFI